jgi:hypothetical protein
VGAGSLSAVPRRIATARALADLVEYEREQEKSEVEKRIMENPNLSTAELLELRDDYFIELGEAEYYAEQVIEAIEPPEE